MADKFRFDEMLTALNKAKVDMPKQIAEAGRAYFAQNFRKEQTPNGEKWQPRKQESNATKSKRGTGRSGRDNKVFKPILVNTGALRSSMWHSIISYDFKKVVWGVDISYAGYLNYGTDKMVARPFIADGKEIRGKIKGIIKREFDKIILHK
jgi:phage gpG-like protein